jgi:hypothetical protein
VGGKQTTRWGGVDDVRQLSGKQHDKKSGAKDTTQGLRKWDSLICK